MKRPEAIDDLVSEEWNKYYSKQANSFGGFCGSCGEGVRPLLNNDIQSFGLCEFNGDHPDCGNHNMVFREKSPDVFGAYEIYECSNSDCDYKEAL